MAGIAVSCDQDNAKPLGTARSINDTITKARAGRGRDLIMLRASAALLLLVLGFAAQAEPMTLTLACTGTASTSLGPPEPPEAVSMGVVIDFSARTVQGFYTTSNITTTNDVTVEFDGTPGGGIFVGGVLYLLSGIHGSIDRVTGTASATLRWSDVNTHQITALTTYTMQCKPAQRVF